MKRYAIAITIAVVVSLGFMWGPDGIAPQFSLTNGIGTIIKGPSSPVAGGSMAGNWIWSDGSPNCSAEGGIWPTNSYFGFCISKVFTSSNTASGSGSPAVSLFNFAANNGSVNDVAANISDCLANGSSATGACFAANFISRTSGGINGKKLVGLEIDMEPEAGVTVSGGSGGIYMNAFNSAIPVVMQMGALGGGSWVNGIIFNHVSGAYIGPQSGATTATTGADWRNGTFTDAAEHFGNQQTIKFDCSSGENARITTTSSDFMKINPCAGGLSIRNPADTVLWWFVNSSGHLNAGLSTSQIIGGPNLNLTGSSGGYVNIMSAGRSNADVRVNETTSPVILSATVDGGIEFDNLGAGTEIDFNLPTATVGLKYGFCVVVAQVLKVVAPATVTINVGGAVSTAAGNIASSQVGACVELEAYDATHWIAKSVTGTGGTAGAGGWTVN